MIELELSTIPDSEQDTQTLTSQLQEFQQQTGVKVRLRQLTWGTAWADLITFSSHGKGPDVSHIGGTWVSSLAMMNALRPFKPEEIEAIGGEKAFLPPTWESTREFADPNVWAIPWTGYIYVICYRKDLLEKVGIDRNTALDNLETMREVLEKLRLSGAIEIPWLNPHIPAPYTDLLHIAASSVWSAGGDFLNEAGTRVTFDSSEALEGLRNWLDLYRAVPEAYKQLGSREGIDLFRQGRVAAVLTDIRAANSFISHETDPAIRENLGVAPIANVPWMGGANFVIWQYVRGYPERERAAVELVKFLTNKENGLRWAREVGSMPARMDVLNEIYPSENPLHLACQQSANSGHAYHTVPLWRRIEYQLAQELGACVQEANAKPEVSSPDILRARLEPLARRLNLTLGN